MLTQVLNIIFGSKNDREIKALRPIVERINGLESSLTPLSDQALAEKTQEFKKRLQDGETLEDILPEAFAVCREMSRRRLNMRHFDVQLIGGMILNKGRIAEMKTGEGKTLVATLPLYLNALEGKGAHLVTVNDYLAKRDASWMAQLYHALGLTVGIIQHDASFFTIRPTRRRINASSTSAPAAGMKPIAPRSPTAPITNTASITFATT
ncbi:MAG: hypothetical protein U0319_08750 [Nitrospira sp.]